ncbi:hypothetical protein H634G_05502 [Metarhizium anisopliae BRIP 53293]|uniref:Nucleoside phosphorylase domain-containing protein n=1 Tax=Metarhizium anisopliae BRIP 53293 TaxID=1291518 RepID=A0A0D9NYX7_METAN|nr:hypothetical protein H634G_05502 [Metarhizium anisopliae BRIP 53293]KJK95583.1 hypothetical protein H633G_00540 [Metarhizium anisopliae BRIP 53284]
MSHYKFNENFVEPGDLITAYVWCVPDGTIGKATLFNEAKNIYDSGEVTAPEPGILPNGEYRIASSTSVARDMFHTFPDIRIDLLVGIGGGAPSEKNDIRLGDVVVSTPCGKEGGVLQYDFGKAVHNKSFQYTKLLDQPPTALRTALNGIKAQYKRKGHRLQEEIEIALCNNPRLRKRYERPDVGTDTLFKAYTTHDPSCTTLCSDDPNNLVSRPMREQDEDNIVEAHRWTVGSVLENLLDCRSNNTQARVTVAWPINLLTKYPG